MRLPFLLEDLEYPERLVHPEDQLLLYHLSILFHLEYLECLELPVHQ